jgi:hypothetical protein
VSPGPVLLSCEAELLPVEAAGVEPFELGVAALVAGLVAVLDECRDDDLLLTVPGAVACPDLKDSTISVLKPTTRTQ